MPLKDTCRAGHLGHLTEEETKLLKEFWVRLLSELEVDGELSGLKSIQVKKTASTSSSASGSQSSWGFNSLWGSKSNTAEQSDEQQDIKEGDVECISEQLSRTSLASREPSWSEALEVLFLFFGYDHPDRLCLKFIRARKWDIEKAVAMFKNALIWRRQFNVKELVKHGEELVDKSDIQVGKSYIWGKDKLDRPAVYCHVRLHDKNCDFNQTQKLAILTVETGRLALCDNVETTILIFDMTDFGLQNMDYNFVKFLIQCFQNYYPESLGSILIVNAPWIFNGCFAVIKPWLDPIVAAKIKFVKTNELSEHIDDHYIPRIFRDHEESYVFEYKDKTREEEEAINAIRQDKAQEEAKWSEFKAAALHVWKATAQWANEDDKSESNRQEAITLFKQAYTRLVPFIRAKTHYHRIGIVNDPGLTI